MSSRVETRPTTLVFRRRRWITPSEEEEEGFVDSAGSTGTYAFRFSCAGKRLRLVANLSLRATANVRGGRFSAIIVFIVYSLACSFMSGSSGWSGETKLRGLWRRDFLRSIVSTRMSGGRDEWVEKYRLTVSVEEFYLGRLKRCIYMEAGNVRFMNVSKLECGNAIRSWCKSERTAKSNLMETSCWNSQIERFAF